MNADRESVGYQRAAVLAIAVTLASGLGYRAVASRLGEWLEIAGLPSDFLARLPVRIGDWSGEDRALDKLTAEIVSADAHVSRVYTRADGRSVSVFLALRRSDVGYGVPAAELAPHRPEICYPAHGWKAAKVSTQALQATDGSPLPVEIRHFHRGELEPERISVLTYYIVDGRRGHEPSAARAPGWRPKGDVRYVTQVEIASGGHVRDSAADQCIEAFATDSADIILEVVAGAAEGARQPPGPGSSSGKDTPRDSERGR